MKLPNSFLPTIIGYMVFTWLTQFMVEPIAHSRSLVEKKILASSYSTYPLDKSYMELFQDNSMLMIKFHGEQNTIRRGNHVNWKYLKNFSLTNIRVPLFPSFDSQNKQCSLSVQLNATGTFQKDVNIHVFLNNHKIGTLSISRNHSPHHELDSIPFSLLKPGENVLSFVRPQSEKDIAELFLDWIELVYPASSVNTFQVKAADSVGEIFGGIKVGQTFLSMDSAISTIQIMMVFPPEKDKQVFHLDIAEIKSPGKILRTVSIPGKNLESYKMSTFSFPPLVNTQGKTYIFYIYKTEKNGDHSFTVLRSSNDTYPHGNRYINDKVYEDDLRFIVYSD